MLTATMRIAYAQVDSFLEMLEEKYVEMVPRNIRYFFKQEKDTTYNKPVVPDIPIKNQNLTDEALALIAYLNLNYWCQDAKEKEELKKKYIENEDRYNEEVRNYQHGADDIFKTKVDEEEREQIKAFKEGKTELIEYKKENIFSKIWYKIKSKFLK